MPSSALTFDKQGNFYGTTLLGGAFNDGGEFFEFTPKEGGGWDHTVLYDFGKGLDGNGPNGNLLMDAAGNFYGTTDRGGSQGHSQGGYGTVYEIIP